jgi:tricorn protease
LASPDSYLRYPAIGGGTVLFVCEDDLWSAPIEGGVGRRLTADLADIGQPAISADGAHVAFTSEAEGPPEVYSMPAVGGPARRLTWLGDHKTAVRGFTPDGEVLFVSSAGQPFGRITPAYAVGLEGGPVRQLPYGTVGSVGFGPSGAVVLGRNTEDPATWKRYRGGTAGRLWIDPDGSGTFHRLLAELDTNFACPLWIGDRVYFISDHEGVGNIYSCTPDGGELRRHTDHDTYYARNASTDGHRIVYQHAGSLWLLDPTDNTARQIPIRLAGPRTQRNRRFVDASRHLSDPTLHPDGHTLLTAVRGKLVTMPAWEEAASQHGTAQGVRYRLAEYLDGERIVAVSDAAGEDGLELVELTAGQEGRGRRLTDADLGGIREIAPAPDGSAVAVCNRRRQLLIVTTADGLLRVADEAPGARISGLTWSPDSAWLAYSYPVSAYASAIRVVAVESGEVHEVVRPDFRNEDPNFDPQGRYLYFLSRRTFNPVMDDVQFSAGFPKAGKPYLVTLRPDLVSPFIPVRRPLEKKDDPADSGRSGDVDAEKNADKPQPTVIDFDGIADRVVAFPLPEERYTQVIGIGEKVLICSEPVTGERGNNPMSDKVTSGVLGCYDLSTQEYKELSDDAGDVVVSADHSTMLYRASGRVRIVKAGVEPAKDAGDEAGRESGWVDIDRIRIPVDPSAEWPQMLAEAWRLQRDRYWIPDMAGIDWPAILRRYEPLAHRVATRAEFSDLLWELQGELGTSHAYEMGGDYRPTEHWAIGQLGADLRRDDATGRWHVGHIVVGDSWDPEATSPLAGPGVGVREGDTLLAVGGQPVDPLTGPGPLLVHQADQAVELTVAGPDGAYPRRVTVKTLDGERRARYREWVERNRKLVHEASAGRIGYLHVPDMWVDGYAEFHRAFLTEHDRDALVVDVRFNGGGAVSGLLLDKLTRKRIGATVSRWRPPEPYPDTSPAGPMVCLTNEHAGSDGDIFTHAFSMLELGPVVGMRTWGGVIGISPDVRLADGTMTTQPEYAFWFADVGWGLENRGTEPDIEVDVSPQESAAGADPQLEKAIEAATEQLKVHQPLRPDVATRASRAGIPFPPRT